MKLERDVKDFSSWGRIMLPLGGAGEPVWLGCHGRERFQTSTKPVPTSNALFAPGWFACVFLVASVFLASATVANGVHASPQAGRLRRPVALALSEDERWLYTANRDSGSISIIDLSSASVAGEIELGGRLTDIALLDESHLLVVDNDHHDLVVLTGSQRNWQEALRLRMPQHPVQLQVDRLGARCFVASHWSRTISRVEFADADRRSQPQLARQQKLPFEPGEIMLIESTNQLVVAAAYSGTLAILDSDSLEIVSTQSLRGHNIRGLALGHDGRSLWVAHQELNPLARTTRDDVHWGNTLTNLVSSFLVEELQEPTGKIMTGDQHFLGEPEHAASDPGKIAVGPAGVAIVLSGVHELAIAPEGDCDRIVPVSVGRRPSDVLVTRDGRWIVSEMFSDSVSIVQPNMAWIAGQTPGKPEWEKRGIITVKLGEIRELTPEERGEELFFDGRLSHDGWMSCHSCHTEGHTSEQLNDNLSDGSFGTPKRVLSLLGAGKTQPWAWNGSQPTLGAQIESTVQNTMQGAALSPQDLLALEAYLKTLTPPLALKDELEASDVAAGRNLFQSLGCSQCHKQPNYTNRDVVDIGMADEQGLRKFNPPSLRGVGRRTAFFHDNRARSLEEVFSTYRHQLERSLSDDELQALLAFLRSI